MTDAALMLAHGTGHYCERLPSQPLRKHFSRAWINRAGGQNPIVVVPDGAVDLQWMGGRWRIAGPDRGPQTETLAAGMTVIGFRFQPGAASGWLGPAMSGLCDQRVWLEDIWGPAGRRADRAARACDPKYLVVQLEQVLAGLAGAMPPPRPDLQSAHLILSDGPPSGRDIVPHLMAELGMSERTLRRQFEASFGYGPKTLHRILRFQRYLRLARENPARTIGLLAADAGYADQPHLIRECRRLAHCLPSQLPHAPVKDMSAPGR